MTEIWKWSILILVSMKARVGVGSFKKIQEGQGRGGAMEKIFAEGQGRGGVTKKKVRRPGPGRGHKKKLHEGQGQVKKKRLSPKPWIIRLLAEWACKKITGFPLIADSICKRWLQTARLTLRNLQTNCLNKWLRKVSKNFVKKVGLTQTESKVLFNKHTCCSSTSQIDLTCRAYSSAMSRNTTRIRLTVSGVLEDAGRNNSVI